MKKAAGAVLGVALLAAAALALFQGVLNRRLPRLLETGAVGGVPVRTEACSVNLWAGSFAFRDAAVANRPGFPSADRFRAGAGRIAIRLAPLLRRRLQFREITLRGIELSLERDAGGRWNVEPPFPRPRSGDAGPSAPAESPAPPSRPVPREPGAASVRAVSVERMAADGQIRVRLGAPGEGPAARDLRLQFVAAATALSFDRAAPAADAAAWGRFTVTGCLEGASRPAPFRIEGRLAPVADPRRASFRLSGTLEGVEADWLKRVAGSDLGIRGDPAGLAIEARCDAGRFDPDQSRLTVTLTRVKVGSRRVPELTLRIPISGPLDRPRFAFEQAALGALAQVLTGSSRDRESGAAAKGER